MRPEALARQIDRPTRLRAWFPCFVCATVGTTSSNAIDPVPEIARICREHESGCMWTPPCRARPRFVLSFATFMPESNSPTATASIRTNGCSPISIAIAFTSPTARRSIQTLSVLPEYLRNQATESGAVIDYRDWQIPLGRRFRALKLWFVIRHYGVEGLQHHIREHVALAQQFAEWVKHDERFELAAPAPLNLVCFRLKAGDAANQALLDRLNRSGELYLTHTRLNDRFTLRICVGQTNTRREHVERAWKRIREEARAA